MLKNIIKKNTKVIALKPELSTTKIINHQVNTLFYDEPEHQQLKVAIIINAEDPETAEFLTDSTGNRLLFESHDAAEQWCMKHAQPGVSYMHWDGER